MRVIHHDGRTGTARMLTRLDDFGRADVQCGVAFDDGSKWWGPTSELRPLGSVEEELIRCSDGWFEHKTSVHDLSFPAWELMASPGGFGSGVGGWNIPERLSEALDASRGIWERHREVV